MVRGQSMSVWRGRLVRLPRLSAPRIASAVFCSSFAMSSSTTLRITSRAVSLVFSGMVPPRLIRSATRCTSASMAARNSGSCSMRLMPSRSKASFWITWTTGVGKNSRTSPSQRATRGADAPSPPRPFFSSPTGAIERRERLIDALVALAQRIRAPLPRRRRARAASVAGVHSSGSVAHPALVQGSGSGAAAPPQRLSRRGRRPARAGVRRRPPRACPICSSSRRRSMTSSPPTARRSAGSRLTKAVSSRSASQPSIRSRSAASWSRSCAASREKSFDPCAAFRRRHRRREGERQAARGLLGSHDVAVVQPADGVAAQEGRRLGVARQPCERVLPGGQMGGLLQDRDGAVEGAHAAGTSARPPRRRARARHARARRRSPPSCWRSGRSAPRSESAGRCRSAARLRAGHAASISPATSLEFTASDCSRAVACSAAAGRSASRQACTSSASSATPRRLRSRLQRGPPSRLLDGGAPMQAPRRAARSIRAARRAAISRETCRALPPLRVFRPHGTAISRRRCSSVDFSRPALAAQIDGKLLFVGRGLQPQAPLPAFEIGEQRHARNRFVDLADLCRR